MARLAFLLSVACVAALSSFGKAADDPPIPKLTGAALVADRIWWGKVFELTLTAPDTDTGAKFERTRGGVVWDDLVFSNCFATNGKGALIAVVRFPKTQDEFTLRSIGPAEDLYALRTYQLEKTFPRLHKKIVAGAKATPDVTVGQPKLPDKLKETDPVPGRLLPVVVAAGMKYEEKRPELMLRAKMEHSHLFFPQAEKTSWSVHIDGDRLFVTTGCHDKMYYAMFNVEFKKKAGVHAIEWEYVRVHGEEMWKGE
jgi:hypothetical protein